MVKEVLMPYWRYNEILQYGPEIMIDCEIHAGWHFCRFAEMLVGPGMLEFTLCRCHDVDNGSCDDA